MFNKTIQPPRKNLGHVPRSVAESPPQALNTDFVADEDIDIVMVAPPNTAMEFLEQKITQLL